MLAPSLCWLLGAVVATVVWLWEPPLPLSVEDWQGAALPQKAVPASARDLVTELQVFMADKEDLHAPEAWFFGNASAPTVPYAFNEAGWLVRAESLSEVSRVAFLGGRPLSGRWAQGGRVIVFADVLRGLLRLDPSTGAVDVLASTRCDGVRLTYPDDLRVLANGDIVFSAATEHTPFVRRAAGAGGAPGRLVVDQDVPVKLALLSGGRGSGALLRLPALRDEGGSPRLGASGLVRYGSCARLLLPGMRFANGIALPPASEDAVEGVPYRRWGSRIAPTRVLVADSLAAAVSSVTVDAEGALAESDRRWAADLPGLPDNVSPGREGTWLVALPSARTAVIGMLSQSRLLRWVVSRVPWGLLPKVEPFGALAAVRDDGGVAEVWADPHGKVVRMLTSACWVDCDAVNASLRPQGAVEQLCTGAAPGDGLAIVGTLKSTGLMVLKMLAAAPERAAPPLASRSEEL
ncbi:hypothetical protein FNF27_01523 [Cafeteria roenbergensis]|uniref:Strictosidine synthase conserved region domain-containing protein n=1 Tax=Cafeteria roenbergensis TaxID=33653 RepID=A0A5A8EIS4_CAFRO|nr:hypothetical protein FNF27_01523 [Cafeteria roenbergensis]